LSYPKKNSVNDFIDEKVCAVKYSSFDQVLDIISGLGKSPELGKIDIRQAFRLIIINPPDFDLLGIMFDGKYYVDKCLPMGCSISCTIFEKFSTFLHWVVEKKSGISTLDHYLDDFLFAGAALTNDCKKFMNTFCFVSKELGIFIVENKTEGPITKLTFLDLEIDTVLMKVKIPEENLNKLRLGIRYIMDNKKIKLKELESIIGLMAFCARAIPSARAFLRRFYDLFLWVKVKKPFYYVRINQESKADAKAWLDFLQNFNGECYLSDKYWLASETLKLYTDSAGNASFGCGAYLDGNWAQMRWPGSWSNQEFMSDLSFLELVPVVMALFIWVSEFKNKTLLMKIDNQALVTIINKRTCKSKYVMQLLKLLVLLTMCINVQFKAVHLFGVNNELADSLSRFQMVRFRKVTPVASSTPADITVEFWAIISQVK
jgi:hypothetical protein